MAHLRMHALATSRDRLTPGPRRWRRMLALLVAVPALTLSSAVVMVLTDETSAHAADPLSCAGIYLNRHTDDATEVVSLTPEQVTPGGGGEPESRCCLSPAR